VAQGGGGGVVTPGLGFPWQAPTVAWARGRGTLEWGERKTVIDRWASAARHWFFISWSDRDGGSS
jgi:hypothetical protein